MTIFSDDVDEVRIIGTILIFVLGTIGAVVPIAVARLWGRTNSSSSSSSSAAGVVSVGPDGTPLTRAERRALRKEQALEGHRKQQTLKLIQHLFLALGSGVIVATAIMHMLPEGTEAVAEGYDGLRGGGHAHGAHDDHDDHDHDHDHDHGNETNVTDHDHDHANETNVTAHNYRFNVLALADSDTRPVDNKAVQYRGFIGSANETPAPTEDPHAHAEEEAAEEEGHAHGFPFGYLFVLIGLFITFVAESELHRALDSYDKHDSDHDGEDHDHDEEHHHGHGHSHGGSGDHHHDDHNHDHAVAVIPSLTASEKRADARYRRELSVLNNAKAKAHLMEIAVATHSVIIGVALGTLTKANTADTLALALMFHQLCEGFAVGAVFEAACRSAPTKPQHRMTAEEKESSAAPSFFARNRHHFALALYVAIFALCVPIGIIIGIGVAEGGNDADSSTGLFVRGAFECFAGGVLIYVGCVEFLGGLFGAHSHSHVAAIPEDCSDAEDEAEAHANDDSSSEQCPSSATNHHHDHNAGDDNDHSHPNAVPCREPNHCAHHYHLPTVFCDGTAHRNPDGTPHTCPEAEEARRNINAVKKNDDNNNDTITDGIVVVGSAVNALPIKTTATDKAAKCDKKKKTAAGHDCDHHHHSPNHPQGHCLQTDSLFGRIATYSLVLVGAAAMAVLANWA